MLEENKNLTDQARETIKDTPSTPAPYQAGEINVGSFTKVNKLVTALYMVTDMLENEEPLRRELRTLGAKIITDISLAQSSVEKKIAAIISLLDIGSTINLISEMNCSILKKEFIQLKQSLKESKQDLVLLDFFQEPETVQVKENEGFINANKVIPKKINSTNGINRNSIGSIGIQKGGTLLKALSEVHGMKALRKVGGMSDKKFMSLKDKKNSLIMSDTKNSFDALKKQRRDQIIKIIKACPAIGGDKLEGVGIKDIAIAFQNFGEDIGEKTLQRELVSMVSDGVLKKEGEKRWSRYSL